MTSIPCTPIKGGIEMNESILDSVKQDVGGIEADNTDFDHDIITFINNALWRLNTLGIGVDDFRITDRTSTWNDFVGDTTDKSIDSIKAYVVDSVRYSFDPPTIGSVMTAVEKRMDKNEWLLQATSDKTT